MIDALDRPQLLSPEGAPHSRRPIRVLLVEDETAHVRIAQRAFASRAATSFVLETAESIAAARAAIEKSPPDLVIADVVLPLSLIHI